MNMSGVRPAWNATGGIPLNVTLHGWPVPPPEPEAKGSIPEQEGGRFNMSSRIFNLNATGYVALDEDIMDVDFTDAQTLVIAALGTLMTLVVAVAIILGVRVLWRRYQGSKDEGYEGVLQREESSEPGKNLISQLKTSESQFTAATSEEQTSPTVLTPKSNGSVITMTLKNNHLIVETEETGYISPSVRVDSKGSTTTYVTTGTIEYLKEGQGSHGALVHHPPDEPTDEEAPGSMTGLSQSDLSMSSSGSQNLGYRYGNQTAYESGSFGYSDTSKENPSRPPNSGSRDFMRNMKSPYQMDRNDSVVSASDVNIFLQSDIDARNVALEKKRLAEEVTEIEAKSVSDQPTNSTSSDPVNEQQKETTLLSS